MLPPAELEQSGSRARETAGGMEQLGYLIARNVAPFRGRVHPQLIADELTAVRPHMVPNSVSFLGNHDFTASCCQGRTKFAESKS